KQRMHHVFAQLLSFASSWLTIFCLIFISLLPEVIGLVFRHLKRKSSEKRPHRKIARDSAPSSVRPLLLRTFSETSNLNPSELPMLVSYKQLENSHTAEVKSRKSLTHLAECHLRIFQMQQL
ncbi:putative Phospholipid-transporting ATPase protein, partial [Naja naja]